MFQINTKDPNIELGLEIAKVNNRKLSIQAYPLKSNKEFNRILWGFNSLQDEGFYGFGERFVPE